jgi:hypothetical protein
MKSFFLAMLMTFASSVESSDDMTLEYCRDPSLDLDMTLEYC